jgi:alpha-tubulin suppressor-like RCC1 family protein
MGGSGRLLAIAASAALVVALAPTAWAVAPVDPGPAYSWGSNSDGRLGTGTPEGANVLAPTQIAAPGQFTSISAGWNHGCALGGDDSAYCWGNSQDGQLGNGSTVSSPVPVRALGPSVGFSAIAAGLFTSCALQKGTLAAYCWGQGWYGQLGNGLSGIFSYESNLPVAVSGGRTFRGIDVGQNSVCAVALDDSAYCWGLNSDGQLGNGTSDDSSTVPALVSGSYRFVEVSVGGQFACGVTRTSGDTGPGVCWGEGSQGRLGNGSTDDTNVPVIVDDTAPGVLTLRSIAAGDRHACAISTDDSAYCWGDGSNGQLGNGSRGGGYLETRPTRVLIPGDAPVRDISAGSESSCAITDDTTYCWGWQAYGQVGNGQTGGDATVPAAVTLSGIGAANSPVQVTSGQGYNAFIVKPRMLFSSGTAFPSTQVGQPTSTLVSVQNTRPWTITITGMSVTGAGVTVTGTTCSGALPSGVTCTASLAWAPPSAGALSGTLTVSYVGNSSSTPLTGTASPPPPPIVSSPPRDVSASAGDSSASVNWTAPTSPGSYPVTTYQVTSSPGGHTCLTSALTCTVTGLTNGATYTFTVKALSGAGWGDTSAPSNAVTPVAAPKPSITITGSRDGQRITVTGTARHLDSQAVRPWIRFPGETTFSQGSAVIPIAVDGTFTWSRRSGKKIYVYIAHGTARSNMVTIPAR